MPSEVQALELSSSTRILWSRRWVLVAAVGIASSLAYLIGSALPRTWESQAVVQLGQVGPTLLENVSVLVRRINVGTLECGTADSDSATQKMDGVTAQADAAVEFKELRLIAHGATADEAYDRAASAAACLVKRQRVLFELATQRDAEFRNVLELQVGDLKATTANITRLIGETKANASNTAEILLLVTRLTDGRIQMLELARQIHALRAEHDGDVPTSLVGVPSRLAAPVWPRPRLLALLGGTVALLVSSGFVLFVPSKLTTDRP